MVNLVGSFGTKYFFYNFWILGGTKIALRVESEEQMLDLEEKANKLNVLNCIIRDAGQTQVAPGTKISLIGI